VTVGEDVGPDVWIGETESDDEKVVLVATGVRMEVEVFEQVDKGVPKDDESETTATDDLGVLPSTTTNF